MGLKLLRFIPTEIKNNEGNNIKKKLKTTSLILFHMERFLRAQAIRQIQNIFQV